jgi:hypothetical protein
LFNKDYIMRMIEQLVQGIALIMHLKQENRLEESAEVITDTLRTFYGLNDLSIDNLPWTDLMAVANLGGIVDAEKCALLAQIIKEKADIDGLRGQQEKADGLYVKALSIYCSALLADSYFNTVGHREKIDEIIGLCGGQVLLSATMKLLFGYYELADRLGKAEDMLYFLLDEPQSRAEAVEMGKDFYSRLLLKDDEELANGNLPRSEVLAGQKSWPSS